MPAPQSRISDNPLLKRIVDWHVLRVAPKTDADFASTWRMLRENPDWPEPELLRRQAEDRIGPDASPQQVFLYFTAFPPLTSAGHLKRLEAAAAASPNDVAKFASDSWRNATFRAADEDDFLNKYGRYLSGDDHIARFDRILRDGRPQVARDLLPKLPPDYQPLANARLAMATKAADAPTILKGVSAAKLNEPGIKLERLAWLRRSGNFDEAKALAAAPPTSQTDAWWNERQQLARDLLAAGHPADAYAVACAARPDTRRRFRRGRVPRRLDCTAPSQEAGRRPKSISRRSMTACRPTSPRAAPPTGWAVRWRRRAVRRKRWTGSAAPPPSARPSMASSPRAACRAVP